jgi:hypothetical protein
MYDEKADALEPRETRAVIAAAEQHSDRKELTVKALLETGMRASELAHVKPGWFLDDRDPPAIQVPAHEPCSCTQCEDGAERNLRRWAQADTDEDRPSPASAEYERLLGWYLVPVFLAVGFVLQIVPNHNRIGAREDTQNRLIIKIIGRARHPSYRMNPDL